MVLRQGGKIIELTIRKKILFVLNIQLSGKSILMKDRDRPTYLVSKNPQIKLWYKRLGYIYNARVIEASKLTDGIDIMIKDSQQKIEEQFSSNSGKEMENENSKPDSDNNK